MNVEGDCAPNNEDVEEKEPSNTSQLLEPSGRKRETRDTKSEDADIEAQTAQLSSNRCCSLRLAYVSFSQYEILCRLIILI